MSVTRSTDVGKQWVEVCPVLGVYTGETGRALGVSLDSCGSSAKGNGKGTTRAWAVADPQIRPERIESPGRLTWR